MFCPRSVQWGGGCGMPRRMGWQAVISSSLLLVAALLQMVNVLSSHLHAGDVSLPVSGENAAVRSRGTRRFAFLRSRSIGDSTAGFAQDDNAGNRKHFIGAALLGAYRKVPAGRTATAFKPAAHGCTAWCSTESRRTDLSQEARTLRLRGAGHIEYSNDKGAAPSNAAPDLVHQLTRKMEAIWQTADTLRRRRWLLARNAAAVCSGLPGTNLQSDTEGEQGTDCLDDSEAERLFEGLRHHLQDPSALLRHEVCYAMGQTGLPQARPVLIGTLQNNSEHAMVRHEAAEGLAALCAGKSMANRMVQDVMQLLQRTCSDPCPEVAETCQVALERLCWEQEQQKQKRSSEPRTPCQSFAHNYSSEEASDKREDSDVPYVSIDPAPPLDEVTDVWALTERLLDTRETLFQRYRAMFKLRNIGGADAAAALCRALGDSSALFRHEIAFVLGQMGFAGSADALKAVLCNVEENSMVRHEAAEALGALGEEDACRQALMQFGGDADPVVAESCMLALDMLQYWADYKNPPDGHVA